MACSHASVMSTERRTYLAMSHAATLLRLASGALMTLALVGAGPPAATKAPPKSEAAGKSEAVAPEKVQWLTFDAAVAKAEKENKHLLVDVYTKWCGWCKVMDRQTYGDSEVATYLTEHFALAKVNGESAAKLTWQGKSISERDFAREVGVKGYPSTFFMKPNADLLGGVPGFIKAPDMLIYSKYVHTKYYEKGKLQQFADSLRNLGS